MQLLFILFVGLVALAWFRKTFAEIAEEEIVRSVEDEPVARRRAREAARDAMEQRTQ